MSQEHHCIRCGHAAGEPQRGQITEFASPLALKCNICRDATEDERKEYTRLYHRARGRALSRLTEAHPKQFERLLAEERQKIEEEEERKEARS